MPDELARLIRDTHRLRSEWMQTRSLFPTENCVNLPFHSAHRPDLDETPTAAQEVAIQWRNQLKARNSSLHKYYFRKGDNDLLQEFPLAGFGFHINFGY